MPFVGELEGDPKVIFFTDFDGTITLQDSIVGSLLLAPASCC
jgi:hypothetical protein